MNRPTQILDPFASPLYVMAKPAGASCNMRCDYCYYLEKADRLNPGDTLPQPMSDATLEEFIKQYIAAQISPEVLFMWHGGEALLRPISFYEKAIALQQRYAGGRHIDNSIQTNGTLLNGRWCRFFKTNGWLVGLSIDGPEEFHDEYRHTSAGGATFQSVMRGIRLLQRHGVEWNALAVVNDYNVGYPEEFYDFFKQIGCQYIQFTPIVERRRPDGFLSSAAEPGELTDHSVTPEEWGEFLCRVFDRWVKADVGKAFVQIFDATLAGWVGEQPGLCTFAPQCGHAAMMEANGDMYSCDHFAFPEYRLGNIHTHTIAEMMINQRQLDFGAAKQTMLPAKCRECRFVSVCNGGCPKDRFVTMADGHRINYLCEGYRRFFTHVAPYMDFMAAELRAGRAPARVMQANIHPGL